MRKVFTLSFLAGFILGSCTPVPIIAKPGPAVVEIEPGDTVPMFTTRIRMCQPIIREMPNWLQSDPADSAKRPIRYSLGR